jgi:hypothetical protein
MHFGSMQFFLASLPSSHCSAAGKHPPIEKLQRKFLAFLCAFLFRQ